MNMELVLTKDITFKVTFNRYQKIFNKNVFYLRVLSVMFWTDSLLLVGWHYEVII